MLRNHFIFLVKVPNLNIIKVKQYTMNIYKKQVIVNGDYLTNGQIVPRSFQLKETLKESNGKWYIESVKP